jgi:hypothetical protein
MLFREMIAVYCENHMEHINTLCGQNAKLFNVKTGGTYTYSSIVKVDHKGIKDHTAKRKVLLTAELNKMCIYTEFA